MITIFTLINLFTCFFLKKRDNFVCFITPVGEKWLIHMKRLGGCSRPSCPFHVLMVDHATAETEVVKKSLLI